MSEVVLNLNYGKGLTPELTGRESTASCDKLTMRGALIPLWLNELLDCGWRTIISPAKIKGNRARSSTQATDGVSLLPASSMLHSDFDDILNIIMGMI
jgi:hypothetical protein